MKFLEDKKIIIFDFDGVILDSMEVRDLGFKKIFSHYDHENVQSLLKYHRTNGGLSRFNKIKYFYNNILSKDIDDNKVEAYANEFSTIMRNELIKEEYLIKDCVNFIKSNAYIYSMFIASGSEQNELRYLCKQLGLSEYFKEIYGSPTHKNELVKNIIERDDIDRNQVILIGDSINDFEAAEINDIAFAGYNNNELIKISPNYIEKFN